MWFLRVINVWNLNCMIGLFYIMSLFYVPDIAIIISSCIRLVAAQCSAFKQFLSCFMLALVTGNT